ncbi:MAG: RHS repeat-associated core domain-containing protein, partial [Chloroflexi bacterium]|nr:RHS repeat-associated core domain-containing protein [Chloroflexota bacterium]
QGEMGQRRYTPYGSDRSVAGANDIGDEERFTSQRRIDSGGGNVLHELYHYGARWYLPGVGIFTQPDTIVPDYKNPHALNRFAYGYNNPVKYVDPSGHDPLDSAWREAFRQAHRRDPEALDEQIRLFSLAYMDEWFGQDLGNKFYNPDGTANKAAVEAWFYKPSTSRSWDTMGSALGRLSQFYKANEEGMFVRDIGFLYAGMAGRGQDTGLWPYWSTGGHSGNVQVYIQAGSVNPAYINTTTNRSNDEDANVHHWAWALNLGYNLPLPAAQFINGEHEWQQGSGPFWNRQSDRSDLEMGGRGIQMGHALSTDQAGYAQLPALLRQWLGVGGG